MRLKMLPEADVIMGIPISAKARASTSTETSIVAASLETVVGWLTNQSLRTEPRRRCGTLFLKS
jgi:hypothetical protein